jgi:hypothetical protein
VFALASLTVFVVFGIIELAKQDLEAEDNTVAVILVSVGGVGMFCFGGLLLTAMRRSTYACAVHSLDYNV